MADAGNAEAHNLSGEATDGDNQAKSPHNKLPLVNISKATEHQQDTVLQDEGVEQQGGEDGAQMENERSLVKKDEMEDAEDMEQGQEAEDGEEESGEEDEEGSEEEGETDEEGEEGDEAETDDEEGEDEEDGEEVEGDDNEDDDDGATDEEEDGSSQAEEVDDPDVDNCPVCLCPFRDQDVGTPESCDHTFCLECILEWAKNVNTCPVDRSIFRAILVRHAVGGEVVKHIDVDEPKTEFEGYDDEDPTYCEVCGRCDREDRLLLCDGCDAGYHCECLTPPLENIPVEEWFCPECVARNRHHGDTTEAVAGEETDEEWTTIETRPNVVRAIARTTVSERVRAVITRARAERLMEEEATRPKRRKRTTKRKTRRRKRTTSKSPRKRKVKKKGAKRTVKRRKGTKRRKTKKGGVRTVKRTPSTVRGRIAKSLQLVKPRSGSMMPDQKVVPARKGNWDYQLSEIGAAKLCLTSSDALFEPSDDVVDTTSKPAAPERCEPSTSSGGVPDLLGSIMAGQNLLLTKSKNVTIHRDGNLSYKKQEEISKSSPKKRKPECKNDCTEDDEKSNPGSSDEAGQPDGDDASKEQMPAVDREEESQDCGEYKEGSPMEQDKGDESDVEDLSNDIKYNPKEDTNNPNEDINNPTEDTTNPTQADNPGAEDDSTEAKNTNIEKPTKTEKPIDTEMADIEKDNSTVDNVEVTDHVDDKAEEVVRASDIQDGGATKGESKPKGGENFDIYDDLPDKQDDVVKDVCNENNSIPANSKNATTTECGDVEILGSKVSGDVEILKVNINKPKRRDRKGDRKRHGSSSSFDTQSEEEGAIIDKKEVKVKEKKKKKNKDSKRHSKDRDLKGKKTGDSTAEEGEVKSDDDGGGRKKKKQKKKKKNKDKRNVVVDLVSPKPLIPELSKAMSKDGKKSDSDMSKSKERGGSYGDLRQVIQVKRDSHTDEDMVRRYESYWNEFGGKRRGDERRVENANQWEHMYSYGGFGFAEGKQWENFTVQRERSPIYDRRRDSDIIERKRIDARRNSRGGRDRQFVRPEKETMAERAVRLEREAAKRERQQQEMVRQGGREQLTMAEIETRQMLRQRMEAQIERTKNYHSKQGWMANTMARQHNEHDNRVSARDKHGREHMFDYDYNTDRSRDRTRLREKEFKQHDHTRKRQKREISQSSRSRDEYSSERHRSGERRSYEEESDMSRSSSRSGSIPSDHELESNHKALPKTSTVPKQTHVMPGQKPPEVTKKKKKEKVKGKKDKKIKETKKVGKKAKGAKVGKKDKTMAAQAAEEAAAPAELVAAKRVAEEAQEQPAAKKQKKIKGKKDKKKKKGGKVGKAGKVPARPTCMLQDDEDPDIIDLTGEIGEDRSPSTPPTPKPATPTKPPPKDPSPIVSSTADIRDTNHPSSSLYDPFEPTASPPVSYSNSPSSISSDGERKGPSSSMPRVSRGSGDRDIENNSSKRPYSPRDPPRGLRSPQGSPLQATSSSATSIAKLLPALSHNSKINELLGTITNNPALQSVLSASAAANRDTPGSPSASESSYTKMSTSLRIASPPKQRERERRKKVPDDNIGEVTEDDIESSAVDLYNKNSRERYLKKLHHQERVVEEVKLAIKPHYQRREINKDEYKEILRKSVNQVCHSKSGEINPVKIRNLIEGYVKKAQTKRKLGSGNTMKPLIITSEKSRKRGATLTKLIL